ncbi:uncharacterized protein PV09_01952 [Verruconis gallopava]|uniref:Uncharacterized protein n=1 Tax=Verruconis gallopava TaxID=253628 RepID=A0A0D1XWE4_9PEZI|nr:uncharacterized protein PV09_01952 [Verruconis gallopava]KIW07061.1 hypothetical protein PV09_01952 [Verruconis gallopava]
MFLSRWKYNASTAGFVYIHLALWGSLTTLVLALYLFAVGASDEVLVPCAILLIIATSASFAYIAFYEYHARKRTIMVRTEEVYSAARKPVYIASRLSIALAMLWLLSSGWNMIIAARQPICKSGQPTLRLWQREGTCIAQRAGAAFSILNLLIACALFAHMLSTRDPYGTHLLGKARDRPNTVTPYKFSATFRLSKGKQGLVLKRRNSNESKLAAKPLPKTPNSTRPSTPAVETVDPISLQILTAVNLAVSPPTTRSTLRSELQPAPNHTPKKPSNLRHSNTSTDQRRDPSKDVGTSQETIAQKEIAQPLPATTISRIPAKQPLSLPTSRFRPSSKAPLSSHPYQSQVQSRITKIEPASQRLDLKASQKPLIPSEPAHTYSRNHSRNKSAPFPPTVPPKAWASPGPAVAPSHKRGHVRCTSDPNQMISAHLAAEMDRAMRLEFKLKELSQKVEPQWIDDANVDRHSSSSARRASDSGDRRGTTMDLKSYKNDLEKERLYAKIEWNMLMGKEVSILD